MDPDQRQFLTLIILPAILSQQETAWYLGLRLHNIPRLVEAGVISPLGHPKANSVKSFALADLERLRMDTKRLSRAVDSIQSGWKGKNRQRRSGEFSERQGVSGLKNGGKPAPEEPLNGDIADKVYRETR